MKIQNIINIFNSTKDGRTYTKIILEAKKENRVKVNRDSESYIYYEKHHILPKSIFPQYSKLSNNIWNGVLLTAREHFICHLLLVNHYRKIGDKRNWHKMSLAVSKLKCNGKYTNSKLYSKIRKNFKHSEETKKNIIITREKNSKIVFIYNELGEIVEKTKNIYASKKYPPSLLRCSINKFFGSSIGSRQRLRNNGNGKYIGWFVSENTIDINKKQIESNLRIINSDFRDVYVYKLNKLVEKIKYCDLIKKYTNAVVKSSKEYPVGYSKESQHSLKNKDFEKNIGLWVSYKLEDTANLNFDTFGELYIENKKLYNVYHYDKLIYANITVPAIDKKLPLIKFALRKTNRDKPLGYGAGRQTSWLIEKGLINKYKGYFREAIKEENNGI